MNRLPKSRIQHQFGNRPTPDKDPSLDPTFPELQDDAKPPPHFSDRMSEKWCQVMRLLQTSSIYDEATLDLVEGYVVTWDIWRTASDAVRAEGVTINGTTHRGVVSKIPNPAAKMAIEYQRQLGQLAKRLGFDPESRSRINVKALKQAQRNRPQAETRRANAARRIFGDDAV